jgi:hypothetical protein
MTLYPIGSTSITPETSFFWSEDYNATVEITSLGSAYLLRVSKSYRLIKQDEEGRETWNRNLVNLNSYLADTFPQFRLSIDYVNGVVDAVLPLQEEVQQAAIETQQLLQEEEQLTQQVKKLQRAEQVSIPQFSDLVAERTANSERRLAGVQDRLDQITEELERKRKEQHQWQRNGVMAAIMFSFTSEPELVRGGELDSAVEDHLDEVHEYHSRKIQQVLRGPKFRLAIEELDEPRVYNRLEHSLLLNPASIGQLKEENPSLAEELAALHADAVAQYSAYAFDDLIVDGATFKESKATPARAVQSILHNLETESVARTTNAPNDGPYVGTVLGTKQVVGFDPADQPHYYVVGRTGSGKSHFKRVLIENAASLGYHILSINPGDLQNVGINLENSRHNDAVAIAANQYWPDHDRFLDLPAEYLELFTGVNAVSLDGCDLEWKQEFINDLFTRLADVETTDQPLFVFLDEAHRFNEGDAANAIQQIARESRKFSVHLVLVSQSPTDYSYNQRHVRENTVKMFMWGEYFQYADRFIDDSSDINDLQTGQAIIPGTSTWDRIDIEVRDTLTRFWEETPTEEELSKVAGLFDKQQPELGTQTEEQGSKKTTGSEPDIELTEDEQAVVDAIRQYITDHDKRPSKNKTVEYSPFGVSKTGRILEQLVEQSVVACDEETRYGNQAQVYSVTP